MLDGEKQLIKRAIRGEAKAFGSLYDYYQPQIYRFIYLKVSHREEAEDLTHQVFLRSWQKITEYRYEGYPFSSWLYRIARNKVIDYYRTQKIHYDLEEIIEDDINFLTIDDAAAEILDNFFDLERIKEAIQLLKPIEQDVIILRFVEEMEPQEVAKLIDKKPETVRVIQHRALRSLKQILKNKN